MNTVLFQCNGCGEMFHDDGLHLSIHGQAVAHICPSCLSGSKSFRITLKRESLRKPYTFEHFLVLEKFENEQESPT